MWQVAASSNNLLQHLVQAGAYVEAPVAAPLSAVLGRPVVIFCPRSMAHEDQRAAYAMNARPDRTCHQAITLVWNDPGVPGVSPNHFVPVACSAELLADTDRLQRVDCTSSTQWDERQGGATFAQFKELQVKAVFASV
jgi:hypothetical protein